jgi:autotransporter-associated beta strand protein
VSGVLDIQGGEFTVNAGTGNSFVIGEGASATGLLSITGGVFTSNVDIEDGGEGTSRITLDGGELDLVGNEIGSATNNINELNFISGVLSNVAAINGTGGVTKTGAGETLKLEGTNTYTGATLVTAGTFLVNGTHTGGAAYTVNAGTTLGGGGNITLAANQSVNIGGRLAVGDSTLPTAQAATLTITTSGSGALVFQDDSFVEFDLITAGTGALNSSDLLDIDGALTIGSNVTLDVANPNNLTNWAFGDTWQLFDWTNVTGGPPPDESLVVGGSFADILDGTGFTWDFTDLYIGGTVSIVPEPGRAVLLLLGVGALVLRRRRSSVSSK